MSVPVRQNPSPSTTTPSTSNQNMASSHIPSPNTTHPVTTIQSPPSATSATTPQMASTATQSSTTASPTPTTSVAISASSSCGGTSGTTSGSASSSTSTTQSSDPALIDYGLKCLKFIRMSGQDLMYKVFCWITTDKDTHTDLFTYLDGLQDKNRNYHGLEKKQWGLDKYQQKKIKANPAGDELDISILFKCIRLASGKDTTEEEKAAWHTDGPELKNCLYELKKYRNYFAHEDLAMTKSDFQKLMENIKQTLERILEEANKKFGQLNKKELQSEMDRINDDCSDIKDQPVTLQDLTINLALQENLMINAIANMKEMVEHASHMHPLSFLTKVNVRVPVTEVFTKIRVKQEGQQDEMDYEQLLTLAKFKPYQPEVIVVNGLAGSGKTTLVTLATAEWLDGGKGSLRGLDRYELLLRVNCRDTNFTSFSGLLEALLLPGSAKNRDFQLLLASLHNKNLLPYLAKQCCILIIVDGFDERNDQSFQLISDLLAQVRSVKEATLVFTTRPEALPDLLETVKGFNIIETEILGIPVTHRTGFVAKYLDEIQKATGKQPQQPIDTIIRNIKTELKSDHYRLPIYLVIRSWLCFFHQDISGKEITQSELYYHTHKLCQEKLEERLAQKIRMDKFERRERLEEWLQLLYEKAFDGLSRDQLNLPKEVIDDLGKKCDELELSKYEVLGAFFCMRLIYSSVGCLDEIHYSMPHKGFQEYYASRYVMRKLVDEQDSIRRILTNVQPKFQNMLQFVAGQLHLYHEKLGDRLNTAAQEVVDLLHQARVTSREQWLDILADSKSAGNIAGPHSPTATTQIPRDTRPNPTQGSDPSITSASLTVAVTTTPSVTTTVKATTTTSGSPSVFTTSTRMSPAILASIARYFPTGKPLQIGNDQLRPYEALLPYLKAVEVIIRISGDPVCLQPLLAVLANHPRHICIGLHLTHHFHHPESFAASDQIIQQLPSSASLLGFLGQLSPAQVVQLPSTITELWLGVRDDSQAMVIPHLHRLTHLKHLGVHIAEGVSAAALQPLPHVSLPDGYGRVFVYLSDVGEGGQQRAAQVAQHLQPPSWYWSIALTRSRLGYGGYVRLVEALAAAGVRVRVVSVPHTTITGTEEKQLKSLTKTRLGAMFFRDDFSR